MTLFQLEDHLRMLLKEDSLCFEDGDWEQLNKIRWAIEDTREQIEKFNQSVLDQYGKLIGK